MKGNTMLTTIKKLIKANRFLYRLYLSGLKFWQEYRLQSVLNCDELRMELIEQISKVAKPTSDDVLHSKIAKRVISNYRMQKEAKLSKVYEPGLTWQNTYKNSAWLSPISIATDEEIAEALFAGFRNDGLKGDNNYSLRDSYFSRNTDLRTIVYTIVKAYNYARKKIPPHFLEKEISLIGQPIFITYENRKINTDLPYRMYYIHRLMTLTDIKEGESFVWCDLGSGSGQMARTIKDFFPNTTVILVDLPETLLFASYFVAMNFPDARIGYYDELKDLPNITADVISKYDIIFLPNFAYERLDANTVDISWNTASLSEMSMESIQNYIRIIEKTTRSGGYFYCVNRNVEGVENAGDIDIPLSVFPFGDDCWDKISYRRIDKSLDNFFEAPLNMGELMLRRR